jgi:hypothetical protein
VQGIWTRFGVCNDCQSAMCNLQTSICEACATSSDCGEDSFGPCPCYTTTQGVNFCGHGGIPQIVASCTLCPAPNKCVLLGNDLHCVSLCGP